MAFVSVRSKFWLVTALGLVIGFGIFANSLDGDFVYDDNIVLAHGFFNQPPKVLKFFGEPYFEDYPQGGLYRPLTQISFALNFLFSDSPSGFHLINIILHIVNSILVFYLANLVSGSFRLGLFSFLLFLVLPIHVEAVASIVGRAELLSFFFGGLSLLSWLNEKYRLSALLFFLALLSKETALIWPAIFLGLSVIRRPKLKWIWPFVPTLAAYLALRFWVLGQYAFRPETEFVFNPLKFVSWSERLATALKVLVLYLQKIFVPFGLTADYSYDQIPVVKNFFASPWSLVGLLILAAIIFLALRSLRRKNLVLVLGSTAFLLPYLGVSNLIFPIGTIMADRLMYLPSLGAVLLFTALVDRIAAGWQRRLINLTLFALLVSFSMVTILQNRVWADEESLMRQAYNESPNSVVVKANLGVLLLNKNRELARRLALEAYEQYPDQVKNLNLLAALAVIDKNLPEAQRFLERALALRPYHQGTLENLSRIYFTQNKFAEAERTLHQLATRYGGTGNMIFYAVVKVQNRKYQEALEILSGYFGNSADETVASVRDFAEAKLNLDKSTRQIEERFAATASSFRYPQK